MSVPYTLYRVCKVLFYTRIVYELYGIMDCLHVCLMLVPGRHPKINLFGLHYCVICCEVETKFRKYM